MYRADLKSPQAVKSLNNDENIINDDDAADDCYHNPVSLAPGKNKHRYKLANGKGKGYKTKGIENKAVARGDRTENITPHKPDDDIYQNQQRNNEITEFSIGLFLHGGSGCKNGLLIYLCHLAYILLQLLAAMTAKIIVTVIRLVAVRTIHNIFLKITEWHDKYTGVFFGIINHLFLKGIV